MVKLGIEVIFIVNKILKKYIIAILRGLLVNTSQAILTTITWDIGHSPSGGEFVMTQDGIPTFNSFCLEENQYITIGGTYLYQIAKATDGGVANYNGGNVIAGGPDPISIGTAWLYSNFRNGTLAGYNGNSTQQAQLQNTFWYLENELTDTSNLGGWINLAQSSLINVNLFSDANGAYGVNVWNIFDANGNQCQSQLGMAVPETTTVASGALLLIPLFTSLILKRKLS